MTKPIYDAMALTLSYLFMALGAGIALCGAAWARSERRSRRVASTAPGYGAVGYLRLSRGSGKRLAKREPYYVPIEGTVGSGRGCDVQLPSPEIPGRAARLTLTQAGMLLSPVGGGSVRVNGADYRASVLIDDDTMIEWGSLAFQLCLYDGAKDLAAARPVPPLGDGVAVYDEPPRRLFKLKRGSPVDTASDAADDYDHDESGDYDDIDESDDPGDYDDIDESDDPGDYDDIDESDDPGDYDGIDESDDYGDADDPDGFADTDAR
ncbi:MAG: hypothetical protein LBH66_05585 [Oscillospiraceae bacterium]|jgi:hypothetical protein|nr:hypothetical protein [Oscillospiraceae bacterium]